MPVFLQSLTTDCVTSLFRPSMRPQRRTCSHGLMASIESTSSTQRCSPSAKTEHPPALPRWPLWPGCSSPCRQRCLHPMSRAPKTINLVCLDQVPEGCPHQHQCVTLPVCGSTPHSKCRTWQSGRAAYLSVRMGSTSSRSHTTAASAAG